MDFAWEFIAVWKNQYFAMIRIQFPEFFRSAVFFLNGFFTHLLLQKANRLIDLPRKYFPDEQQNKDIVECEVLYEPSPEQHHADIIIIHGLHGSTYKTWRQGVYKCDEIQKVQLRKHIPLTSNVEDNKLCAKCSSSKNDQPACETISSNNEYLDKNLNNIKYYSDSKESLKDSSNFNLEVNNDDIYFKNIDLIRKSFRNSMKTSGKLKDIDQGGSNIFTLENSEYCNCEIVDSTHCGSWPRASNCDDSFIPEKICDSNLGLSENFKYSYVLSNNCQKCRKKQTSNFPENKRKNNNCFISYSFENMSEEIFAFDETYYNSASYEYSNSYSDQNIFQNSFQTEVRRQVIRDDSDDKNMEMLNNLIGSISSQQTYENTNYCECITKSSKEEISFGCYLKYDDIYGNGPKLLKHFTFVFRFLLSFAKEMYSLYKKLWYYSNCSEQLSSCWPRDWLPIDCPYARVISINYTTFLWMPIWNRNCQRRSLHEKSLEMAKQLDELGVGKRPIIWAAHSKGGLFVKQMFINSQHEREGVSGDLFKNTQSMVFYSVPQHGSILAHFFTSPFMNPSIEIMEIRTGSQVLRNLQNEFQEALKVSKQSRTNNTPPIIVSYTETIPTNMSGIFLQIVFPTSADPGVGELYGVPLDHRMICKFASRDSVLYKDLIELVEKASKTIVR